MTLTFVTNLVHHHQLPVADEFFRLLGDSYHYVATQPLPDWLIKGGYDPTLDRQYIIRTYLSDLEMSKARKLIIESDVVIMGDAPSIWADKRNKEGKITFYYTERIYKQRTPWLKLLWHAYVHYKKFGRYKHTYLLCASAFTASDFAKTFCFRGRCFKWGYMTAVNYDIKNDAINTIKEKVRFMWCARFLNWKHPELPVILASRLKERGYSFVIDMFGSGEELENIKKLIDELKVSDYVNLGGNRPNTEILQEMRNHSIFLFTSDRNEGWGAVLNESMSSGCVPIASDAIGSTPYLIKDGVNGLVFHSCDLDSLEKSVCSLLDKPDQIRNMSNNALNTMRYVWSPQNAARQFVELAKFILDNRLEEYTCNEGPASWDAPKVH